jgi:hypothetical protein
MRHAAKALAKTCACISSEGMKLAREHMRALAVQAVTKTRATENKHPISLQNSRSASFVSIFR